MALRVSPLPSRPFPSESRRAKSARMNLSTGAHLAAPASALPPFEEPPVTATAVPAQSSRAAAPASGSAQRPFADLLLDKTLSLVSRPGSPKTLALVLPVLLDALAVL